MKRNAIVRIIIWSIVTVLLSGILIYFLGLWFGIFPDILYYSSSGEQHEEAVPLETEVLVTPILPLSNEDELTIPADSVREIEVEWVAGDIVVMAKDVDQITVSESDISDEKYAMMWQVKGEKLEIVFCEESLTSGLGISFGSEVSKDLYIEVPRDWTCDTLEIDAASATLEMHNMTIREMDFDGASGTCDFQNCQINDVDIDTASGDVYFLGTLDTLDFDAASASFIGDLQNTPSRIDMDSMSGKLDIALPEDCGYTLSMDGMSSRLSSDFYGTQMKNNSHVYGDGRCRINVDGMSCDVTLRKLETYIIDPTEEAAHCTADPCTDPACTEHGHSAEDCNDINCALHHSEKNCADDNCTIHHTEVSPDHNSIHH